MGYPFRSRLEPDLQGNVSVIQMKDVDEGNLLHAEDAIRVSLPNAQPRHFLRRGDLLFRSRGRSNGVTQVSADFVPAVLAAPLLLIRPHSVRPDFLCWYLNAPAAQVQLASLSAGTSVRMISADALRSIEVPLPPPAEQQRIAQLAALAEQECSLQTRVAQLRYRLITHLLTTASQETTP